MWEMCSHYVLTAWPAGILFRAACLHASTICGDSAPSLHPNHPLPACSPGRIGRMLRVIRAALPTSEEQQAAGGASGPGGTAQAAGGPGTDKELWRQHAEYEGRVRVLAWAGLGRTSVAWCPRHGIIYQVRAGGALSGHRGLLRSELPAELVMPGRDAHWASSRCGIACVQPAGTLV